MRRTRHWLELVIIVTVVAAGVAAWRASHPQQPVDTGPEMAEALRLFRAHQYARAMPWFDLILRRDPDSMQGLAYRGTACLRLGRLDQAEADLKKATQVADSALVQVLSPGAVAQMHLSLAHLYLGRSDYADALKSSEAALKTGSIFDDHTAEAHQLHALASLGDLSGLSEEGRETEPPAALGEFEQITDFYGVANPDQRKQAYVHLTALQYRTGEHDTAMATYTDIPKEGDATHAEPCPLCDYYKKTAEPALKAGVEVNQPHDEE